LEVIIVVVQVGAVKIHVAAVSSPYQASIGMRLVFASGCTPLVSSLVPGPALIYISGFQPDTRPTPASTFNLLGMHASKGIAITQ